MGEAKVTYKVIRSPMLLNMLNFVVLAFPLPPLLFWKWTPGLHTYKTGTPQQSTTSALTL